MIGIWLGVTALAGYWVLALPVLGPPQPGAALLLAGGAVLCFAVTGGTMGNCPTPSVGWPGLTLAVSAVAAYFVPTPYCLGFGLWSLSAVLDLLGRRRGRAGGVVVVWWVAGGIALAQAVFLLLLTAWSARHHELPGVAPWLGGWARLLGVPASWTSNQLTLPSHDVPLRVDLAPEKLGSWFLGPFCVGGLAWLAWFRRPAREYVAFTVVVGGYAVIRFLTLLLLMEPWRILDHGLFWRPWILIGSFGPLPLLLGAFWPSWTGTWPSRTCSAGLRQNLAVGFAGAVAAGAVVFALAFQDPGAVKGGRVLVDEQHSNWEWTDRPFNTTWFGPQSTYNYACLMDYLDHYFQVRCNREQPLTERLLADVDVLVLKVPTQPFTRGEVDSIVQFVERGGGLWLIGDHTNFCGSSTYLNQVAEKFGLRFQCDSTHDLLTSGLSVYRPSALLPHPIVRDCSLFGFQTSCSLRAGWSAAPVILGVNLRALAADYSQRGFFFERDAVWTRDNYTFGAFLQAAAVMRGAGRVVAFTDSTVFSNFAMFLPGKPELALNTVAWLNHRNRLGWMRGVSGLGAALLAVGLLYGQASIAWLLRGSVLGVAVGLWLCHQANVHGFSRPTPRQPLVRVLFETEKSALFLPVTRFAQRTDAPFDYETFFVWTQRLGYIPGVHSTLARALEEKPDLLVLVNPTKPLFFNQQARLRQYLELGGRLLVLVGQPLPAPPSPAQKDTGSSQAELADPWAWVWDPRNGHDRLSAANSLLQKYGLRVFLDGSKKRALAGTGGQPACEGVAPGWVRGGRARLWRQDGRPVLAVTPVGRGKVAVFTDSWLFCTAMMGYHQTVPTARQKNIYALEFWLLQEILETRTDSQEERR